MTDKEKYLYLLATVRAALQASQPERFSILSNALKFVDKD